MRYHFNTHWCECQPPFPKEFKKRIYKFHEILILPRYDAFAVHVVLAFISLSFETTQPTGSRLRCRFYSCQTLSVSFADSSPKGEPLGFPHPTCLPLGGGGSRSETERVNPPPGGRVDRDEGARRVRGMRSISTYSPQLICCWQSLPPLRGPILSARAESIG